MSNISSEKTKNTEFEPTRAIRSLSEDVENSMLEVPRSLPAKYFYDERGSLLFDKICDSPEYYPTRTESALLKEVAKDVINTSRPDYILELGSGTSRKTRHLFDACSSCHCFPEYTAVDVCNEILVESKNALEKEYGWLKVNTVVGDYTGGLGNLPKSHAANLFVFLGGTIGNFSPKEANIFLSEIRAVMTPQDLLLIGADRVKEPDILHAAYNDDEGVTAEFNLNLLEVLNRELDADFNASKFEHYAYYNPLLSQIEMHLVSMREQKIQMKNLDKEVHLLEGDHILTEISRKFTRVELENLLIGAGFKIQKHYEAEEMKFSLVLASGD